MDEENRVVFCRRCGKPLKSAYSRKLEFGPLCYKMYMKEREQSERLFNIDKQSKGEENNE